jgi:FkbM family methyltransferase
MFNVLVPALEEASGKKHEKDFRICYSPEFIALGSVVRDILQPDFVLIGESCSRTGEFLAKIYRDIVGPHVPIERMNFVSAEITKLALNCYVTLKISYANMLGQVCDSIPGADAPKVCKALGNDGRIGSRYLVPATAYGGPCFPRDNRAFSNVVGPLEVMPQVVDAINRRQTVRIGSIVLKALSFGERVAVLGLAYKPGTPVVEESAGVAIAEFLADRIADRMLTQPIVWDPLALDHAQQVLGDKVEYGESLATTLRTADVIVVMLPCSEFVEMPPPELVKTTVIDLWGIVNQAMDELNGKNIRDLVGRDDPTILEIGCNDGTDTLLFLEAMPRATIYCFEPDPRAIERFHKTVSDCRATLIEAAVCCEDGEALFYGSSGRPPNRSRKPGAPRACWLPEWDLSGSLLQPTGHLAYCPWATFPQDRQYKVRTVRLDTWMEERPEISQIDFIWCDVQGAEANSIMYLCMRVSYP